MKQKIIFLAALSILSTQTFAIEITKGKLISHKEWTTDKNLTGHIQELKLKTQKSSLHDGDPIPMREIESISATATMEPRGITLTGTTNTNITLKGNTTAEIKNFTDETQEYQIYRYVCTDIIPSLNSDGPIDGPIDPPTEPLPIPGQLIKICLGAVDTIDLDPNGSIKLNQSPSASYKYIKPGFYNIGSEIYVNKLVNNKLIRFSSSSEDAWLKITDATKK